MAKKSTKHANRTRKVALVTGGGTGMGRATANALVRDGFTVAVCGRRVSRLKPKRSEKFHPYACDIADNESVRQTVKSVLADHGRLDVVVNNAGIMRAEKIGQIKRSTIDDLVRINLIGTINVSLACIPALTKTKGHLIMVSSVLAQRPNPGTSIYAATKGGIESFAKALAVELAPKKVRCNIVAPALVDTEIYAHAMDSRTFNKFLKERGDVYPIGRAGVPEDISELIAYLASDHTTWMTGVLIPVDGGRMVG